VSENYLRTNVFVSVRREMDGNNMGFLTPNTGIYKFIRGFKASLWTYRKSCLFDDQV